MHFNSEHKSIENWGKGASIKMIFCEREVFDNSRRMSSEVLLTAVDVSRTHAHILSKNLTF